MGCQRCSCRLIHERAVINHGLTQFKVPLVRINGLGCSILTKSKVNLSVFIEGTLVDFQPFVVSSSLLESEDVLVGLDVLGSKLGLSISPTITPTLTYELVDESKRLFRLKPYVQQQKDSVMQSPIEPSSSGIPLDLPRGKVADAPPSNLNNVETEKIAAVMSQIEGNYFPSRSELKRKRLDADKDVGVSEDSHKPSKRARSDLSSPKTAGPGESILIDAIPAKLKGRKARSKFNCSKQRQQSNNGESSPRATFNPQSGSSKLVKK